MTTDPADPPRERGIQVTAQRLAVVRAVISSAPRHGGRRGRSVRAEIGAISQQSVYDAWASWSPRAYPAHSARRSPAGFENRFGDNHHHLICRTCGRTVDVDCAIGAAPCLTAADDSGYEIDEAEVVYWGRCPDCVAQSGAAPDAINQPDHAEDPAGTHRRRTPTNPLTTAKESSGVTRGLRTRYK